MFYDGNDWVLEPGMVMFAHMILMDSATRNGDVPRPHLPRHAGRQRAPERRAIAGLIDAVAGARMSRASSEQYDCELGMTAIVPGRHALVKSPAS